MSNDSSVRQFPLTRWDRLSIASMLLLFVSFGVVTEIRSAFQKERKTDFGVYTTAGWAVRTGLDPYAVTDEHGWHYCYPPPFAIAMSILADPPAGEPQTGYVPFAVSVGIWYVLSLIAICFAVHAFASAGRPNDPRGSRIWWLARIAPLWICMGGIGMTLGRGQVNLVVVAFIAMAITANIRNNRFRAGLWLGLATCIKVIPVILFLVPVVRRDWRMLAGGAASAILLLGAVPTAVWGVRGAVEMNGKMIEQILRPGVLGGEQDARAEELTNAIATDNQSFRYVIHNWRHPDEATRPKDYEPISKYAHVLLSLLLFGLTTWGILRSSHARPTQIIIAYGCLAAMLPLVSPVSHMHYYAFSLPLVAGLWLNGLAENSIWPDRTTTICLSLWGLVIFTSFLPIPFWKGLRPFGSCSAATLLLWAYGVGVLVRSPFRNRSARGANGPLFAT